MTVVPSIGGALPLICLPFIHTPFRLHVDDPQRRSRRTAWNLVTLLSSGDIVAAVAADTDGAAAEIISVSTSSPGR